MNRKNFLKNSLLGLGTILIAPTAIAAETRNDLLNTNGKASLLAASKSKSKLPSDLIRENIVGDREGVALQIRLTVLNKKQKSTPYKNAIVDVWHCDASGKYSKYDGEVMNSTEYTRNNFLRGRQTTDEQGETSFISIFPGWYKGRAPHIHVKISNPDGRVLHSAQIALPNEVCNQVYSTEAYEGKADTTNEKDELFSSNLKESLANKVIGNPENGYILEKTLLV